MMKKIEMSQYAKYACYFSWQNQDGKMSHGDLALFLLQENGSRWCLDQ
ncbi:unnamed protein product [Gulo gulo]|uniref:Uncharacterized protein n=1 Tax=Gulo gulo TaxID=48420 RepID=A0A9X9Q3L3_GULGU|nr:unnamed protein product [Gulo gulo]